MIPLSVLDQSPIAQGEDAATALRHSEQLAQHCDRLGYHRYWLAEHHASKTLASSSPEILITRIAGATSKIRVGSGGVMLSHYSPFKVAENFLLLATLYPDRIDLGVGRAPGSDGLTAAALAYGNPLGIEYYPAKVKDMVAFITGETPLTEAFEKLKATPAVAAAPQVWMLGSSMDSATYAARFGLAFSYAHFIAPEVAIDAMHHYRSSFVAEHYDRPYASIGVAAITSDDPEKIDRYRRIRELSRLRRDAGQRGPVTPEEAMEFPFDDASIARMNDKKSRQIIDTPGETARAIRNLARDSGADEVVVLTNTYDFDDRLRSYELLIQALAELDEFETASTHRT